MILVHAAAAKNIKDVVEDKGMLRDFFLCFLSAGLLILSFPKIEWWFLGWIGLIPWMWVLDGKGPRSCFGLSYLVGLLFFWGTLWWFVHVTILGATLLMFYLAVYFGLFGIFYFLFSSRSIGYRLFLLPASWVFLEFLRSHLLTGFGWASLGHSQYRNLPLIQIADLTGVFGISFLMVMVNILIKELIGLKGARADKNIFVSLSVVILCFLIFSFGYGYYRLREIKSSQKASVAIIQTNIPQEIKWESEKWPSIMETHLKLTKEAAVQKPELIIWPETAFPGYVWESPELFEELKTFVKTIKIPLLLGLVEQINENYYNSAVLISDSGEVVEKYDKLHLVPFGEYIPLRNIFPFLSAIVPIGDFTPGVKHTLFPVFSSWKKDQTGKEVFAALICFEDTIPELSREFTSRGAHLLVNITNDAWFQDTNAPFMHLAAALFRAIENRRSLIHVANTGVSCFVDPSGRITNCVKDQNDKKTYVAGFAMEDVLLKETITFYTKYGDIFTYLCFGGILWGIVKRA